MENLYTISRGDRVEKKRALTRIYSASEILRLLTDAGFSSFETYGSVEGEPFRLGSPRLFVIAVKDA
nr:SAM-dependent methyltransferase [Acidobacteriota bacterium]